VIDAFVEMLNLADIGFDGVIPEETGRPRYHPATMLKTYVYSYLELIWLARRLASDFKTDRRLLQDEALKHVATDMALHVLAYNYFVHEPG
jgi:transposase